MFRAYFIKKNWIIAALIAIVLLVVLLVLFFSFYDSGIATSASSSNAGCSWGLKRNKEHQTPEAPADGVAMLKEFGGFFVGDEAQPRVYFTFDEGYEAGYTAAVLDILKEKNVHAVFFITGWYLKSQPELVTRMIEEGHDVGNHTDQHKDALKINEDEIRKDITTLSTAFNEKYNKSMRFYRPPSGNFDRRALSIAKEEGLTTLLWSWAYADWEKPKGKEYVCNLARENTHNGAIFLFHVATTDPVESLATVIDNIRADGYQIGEPGELISLGLEGQ